MHAACVRVSRTPTLHHSRKSAATCAEVHRGPAQSAKILVTYSSMKTLFRSSQKGAAETLEGL